MYNFWGSFHSSGAEIMDATKISIVYIRFFYEGKNIDYIDGRGNFSPEEYKTLPLPENPIPISRINSNRQPGDIFKLCHFFGDANQKESIFANHLATYFPAYRYELPAYLNDVYKPKAISFNIIKQFNGMLPNPIEVVTDLDHIASWLLDVVLDWNVYGQKKAYQMPGGGQQIVDTALESLLWNNVRCCSGLFYRKRKIIRYDLESDGGIEGTPEFLSCVMNRGDRQNNYLHQLPICHPEKKDYWAYSARFCVRQTVIGETFR